MKKFLLSLAVLLVSFNANAENIICKKMKGNLLNFHQDYIPVEFEADKVILRFDNNKATMISGQESLDFVVLENNEAMMNCISMTAMSNNMLTYYKEEKKLYYSKNNSLYQVQYNSTCEELK